MIINYLILLNMWNSLYLGGINKIYHDVDLLKLVSILHSQCQTYSQNNILSLYKIFYSCTYISTIDWLSGINVIFDLWVQKRTEHNKYCDILKCYSFKYLEYLGRTLNNVYFIQRSNRPVSQIWAPSGGLSRTSGKLWQDNSNCYMFWT